MAEINTKLSSSASSWIYKDTDGIANSTVFGTGSGDTHKFTGSIFTTGSQTIQITGDLTWFNDAGLGTPESLASSVSPPIDRYIIGERAGYAISGAIEISSTDYVTVGGASQIIIDRGQQRSLILEANNNIQLTGSTIEVTGSINTNGDQIINKTEDTSWFGGGFYSPESYAGGSANVDNLTVGDNIEMYASGTLVLGGWDTGPSLGGTAFIKVKRAGGAGIPSASIEINAGGGANGADQVRVVGPLYAFSNIYNNLQVSTATSITASALFGLLAISASGPTSVLLPPAEERLELTIADVSGSAGTNAITINASGSNKIQGASSLEISSNYGTVTFIAYDSTNWHIKSTN